MAKGYALRCVRGTASAFLFGNPARGHRSFTNPAYGESRLKRGSLRLKLRWGGVRVA
jgi:hypothetical protein